VLVGSGYYAGRLSLLGALAVVAIAAVIMLVLWYKSASKEVWVYKEGVLAQRQSSIWKLNEMDWYQLPWDNIVHIDLTGKEFSVLYVGSKLTRGPHHFKTMSKAERKRVIDELRSFQQRGDIPATVRILDK
jgi:hypothetical protein